MFKIFIVISIFSSFSLASWSESSITLFKSKQSYIKYEKPAFITYWGGVKRYLKGGSLNGDEVEYQDPSVKYEIKVYIYKKDNKKRPLVILFPGIHGSHNGRISPVIINWFEKKSFHFASVPNFLHKDYIKAKPKYDDNNSSTLDSQIALRAIDFIVNKIGKENISHITFLGESLGAFLSSSTVRFINDHEYLKQSIKNVILLWPPLKIGKALVNFDGNINKTKAVHEKCNFVQDLYRFFKILVWQDLPKNYNLEDETCLDAALYHAAFLKSIRRAHQSYIDTYDIEMEKLPNNFSDFFREYNPNFIKVAKNNEDQLSLKNFIVGWKSLNKNVKVVSSTDDFLNNLSDWDDIEDKFLFNWGSHCAPLALDMWGEILTSEAL